MNKSLADLTPAQLEREIRYYEQALATSTSADRIRRAHVAIRRRREQLARLAALHTRASADAS